MSAQAWEALSQWADDAARIERLTEGVANDVWSVCINGQLAVGRLGKRSDADLNCEAELLQYLNRQDSKARKRASRDCAPSECSNK